MACQVIRIIEIVVSFVRHMSHKSLETRIHVFSISYLTHHGICSTINLSKKGGLLIQFINIGICNLEYQEYCLGEDNYLIFNLNGRIYRYHRRCFYSEFGTLHEDLHSLAVL